MKCSRNITTHTCSPSLSYTHTYTHTYTHAHTHTHIQTYPHTHLLKHTRKWIQQRHEYQITFFQWKKIRCLNAANKDLRNWETNLKLEDGNSFVLVEFKTEQMYFSLRSNLFKQFQLRKNTFGFIFESRKIWRRFAIETLLSLL